jgi:hypothetical protein
LLAPNPIHHYFFPAAAHHRAAAQHSKAQPTAVGHLLSRLSPAVTDRWTTPVIPAITSSPSRTPPPPTRLPCVARPPRHPGRPI